MTLYDEGKLLRREVDKLRPDKRRRYPQELRQRILSWVERAMDEGRRPTRGTTRRYRETIKSIL
jgi:hypothetical protein